MTEAEYLAAEAEWIAAGPPAPMTAEQGSWLIAIFVCVVFLVLLMGSAEE